MFKSAKIKLTAWYLLIIMTVSISFSTVVYTGVSAITKRALDNQRIRIERRIRDMEMMRPTPRIAMFIDEGALIEVRQRTLGILAVINAVILIVAGGLGYFLAGRTLQPIEVMLNKQRRFISDAAHELKTPITAMKTDMEVTLRDKKPSLQKFEQSLRNSIEEADKLNVFVNNLLQKSRYDLNSHREEKVDFDLSETVMATVKTLEPLAKDKKINIKTELRETKVTAGKTEMTELVMNLIDNAIKYSEATGEVKISLSTNKNICVLEVSDQGIGIEEQQVAHIFEPFYKVDQSRTKGIVKGYGLGLAIVKDIVDSYQGDIKVESKIGEGTKISVFLPIMSKPLSLLSGNQTNI